MTVARMLVIAMTSLLLSSCVGLELTSGRVVLSDEGVKAGIVLSSDDRAVIARYYSSRAARRRVKRTPHGLAKKDRRLPHGLAKRDVLPRGLQGRGLPVRLERLLSPPPNGYSRVVIGTDIVLLDSNTRVVMDIYRDIVR